MYSNRHVLVALVCIALCMGSLHAYKVSSSTHQQQLSHNSYQKDEEEPNVFVQVEEDESEEATGATGAPTGSETPAATGAPEPPKPEPPKPEATGGGNDEKESCEKEEPKKEEKPKKKKKKEVEKDPSEEMKDKAAETLSKAMLERQKLALRQAQVQLKVMNELSHGTDSAFQASELTAAQVPDADLVAGRLVDGRSHMLQAQLLRNELAALAAQAEKEKKAQEDLINKAKTEADEAAKLGEAEESDKFKSARQAVQDAIKAFHEYQRLRNATADAIATSRRIGRESVLAAQRPGTPRTDVTYRLQALHNATRSAALLHEASMLMRDRVIALRDHSEELMHKLNIPVEPREPLEPPADPELDHLKKLELAAQEAQMWAAKASSTAENVASTW